MKRTPPKRKTPLQRSGRLRQVSPKRKSVAVPKDIYAEVVTRDRGCVAERVWPEVRCAGRLDPHHVLRRSHGGPDTAENLVTLCRAHHDAVHANPARSYALGLLRRSSGLRKESREISPEV